MTTAYRTMFGLPGVPAQAVFGFLAQLTQSVAPAGIVLVVKYASGSLALAGLVAAAFGVGAGMGRPVQGRIMDRRGTRAVLTATALTHVGALLALVAGTGSWPWPVIVALAWLAGLGLPPISLSMRIEWGRRMPEEHRTAAYSLTYLVQELAMLVGPLLFGLLIVVASAGPALAVTAVAAGAGTLAFSRVLRDGAADGARGRGRVFADRRMFVLLGVVMLFGGMFGAIEVGVPALAAARDVPAATGLLVAALSAGGIIGAAAYGARSWGSAPEVRLVTLMLALGVALSPLVLIESLAVFGVVLCCAGTLLNPPLTTASLLVDTYAPGAQGEAFGWMSTAIGMGGALGSAVAGVAGEQFGPTVPFLVAAGFALVAGGAAGVLIRRTV